MGRITLWSKGSFLATPRCHRIDHLTTFKLGIIHLFNRACTSHMHMCILKQQQHVTTIVQVSRVLYGAFGIWNLLSFDLHLGKRLIASFPSLASGGNNDFSFTVGSTLKVTWLTVVMHRLVLFGQLSLVDSISYVAYFLPPTPWMIDGQSERHFLTSQAVMN